MSDADPAAAFDALGDETRVAILRALVEHRRDDPVDPRRSGDASAPATPGASTTTSESSAVDSSRGPTTATR